MSDKSKAAACLIFSAFLGGAISPSLVKIGLLTFDPLVFNFLRAFITFVLFLPIAIKNKHFFKTTHFWITLIIFGITITGNTLTFSYGIPHTTIVASQLLYALLPVTVPVLAYLWLGENVNSKKIIGATIALIGVALLVIFSRSEVNRLSLGSWYGNSLILLAVGSYTCYLVYSKKISELYNPAFLAMTTYMGMSLVMLPLALGHLIQSKSWPTPSLSAIASLVVLGIISQLFIFCIQYGTKKVSSMTVAICALLAPIFASLAGVLVFHEKFSLILVMSMVLVTSGVLISFSGERQTWQQKLASFWQRIKALATPQL